MRVITDSWVMAATMRRKPRRHNGQVAISTSKTRPSSLGAAYPGGAQPRHASLPAAAAGSSRVRGPPVGAAGGSGEAKMPFEILIPEVGCLVVGGTFIPPDGCCQGLGPSTTDRFELGGTDLDTLGFVPPFHAAVQ
jgi:hypothetical protein